MAGQEAIERRMRRLNNRPALAERAVRHLVLILVIVASALLPSRLEASQAQRGVALVIGQSGYAHLPPLPNPASDARRIDEALRSLGFETTLLTNLDSRKLRRAFGNFIEDAEGADVAVVYYSGHGIEAGGSNWLLPVDADLSSLEDADRRILSLSAVIEELNAVVPLSMTFLDACRSNPFPPGTILTSPDGAALQVSAAGLGATRGAVEPAPASGGVGHGALIGFAAEPGRVALDGPAGGNSPYAVALDRHLSAMNGAEIGTVMRMVTQEVYLKTAGQQRPWVSETLTSLVYLGRTPVPPQGDSARILAERRQLLLSIAELSEGQRVQVETAARSTGVPMDALYGLLKALGADAPSDPEALDEVLTAEAARVKDLLSAQRALDSEDPEIIRLTTLARQALEDGALDSNIAFWEQAKARYLAVSLKLDEAEFRLRKRRLEGGEVLASTAAAYELKADYPSAAENYALAHSQVAKWDTGRAWEYKRREADAWLYQAEEKGDNAALAKSLAIFEQALALAPRDEAADHWAWTMNNLGNAFVVSGERVAGTGEYEKAIATYLAALEARPRDKVPRLWANTQNNLAIAYVALAERTGDPKLLDRAIEAYRGALAETDRSEDPLTWAAMMSNLGDALTTKGGDQLEEAVAVHQAALQERPRDHVPLLWAASQTNIGSALEALGHANGDGQTIRTAIEAYMKALEIVTRDDLPLRWADLQYNLGNAYGHLGELETGTESVTQAVASYRNALTEESFDRTPLAWAKTQYMLAQNLALLSERTSEVAFLKESIASTRQALRFYTRDKNPADWAITVYFLAERLNRLGNLVEGGDISLLAEAVETYRLSLTYYTRERNSADWADTQSAYAGALSDWALLTGRDSGLLEAIAAYQAAEEVHTQEKNPVLWASIEMRMGVSYYYLAILGNSAEPARLGRARLASAAEVFEDEGKPRSAAAARSIMAGIDEFIARLPQ